MLRLAGNRLKDAVEHLDQGPCSSSAADQPPCPKSRDLTLDGLKLAAALLIVLQHTLSPTAPAAKWAIILWGSAHIALPTFFAAAGFLHGRSTNHRSRAWLRRRLTRLLWPWLFWVPIFTLRPLGAQLAFDSSRITTTLTDYLLLNLMGGGGLWFLPQLMVITMIAWSLRDHAARIGVVAVCALAFAPIMSLGLDRFTQDTYWAYLPLYLSLYLGGYAISTAEAEQRLRLHGSIVPSIIAVVAAFGAGMLPFAQRILGGPWAEWGWMMYPVGGIAALALLAGRQTTPIRQPLEWLGSRMYARDTSLGLYAIHPLLLAPMLRIVGDARTNLAVIVAMWLLTSAISLAVVLLMKQWRITRRFV